MISPIAKALVEQHDRYLSDLETAQRYLAKEKLTPEDVTGLVGIVRKLQADKASPTFLLLDQQKALENVFASAQKYAGQRKQEPLSSTSTATTVNPSFSLDIVAADNGAKKTPGEWFDHWSNDTSGKVMASAGDLYHRWKQLKRDAESSQKSQREIASRERASFHEDFDWQGRNNYLIGGTRLEYQPDSLDATIIQHYKARNPSLAKRTPLEISEYPGVPVVDVVKEQKGVHYLQVLFDTEDNEETIMETLEFVSGKQRSEIKIWTPPLAEGKGYYTRKQHPNRAAGFSYGDDYFLVGGDYFNFRGRSRGVAVE